MSKSSKFVHISQIVPGDTVIHNGQERTVTKTNIKNDPFMGRTLFGDSYNLGTKLIERITFEKVKA